MSLLCAEAELPGTGFSASSAIGHFQGIQEQFATIKDYPPLNLVFYVDADHVMIEIFDQWMEYINPTIGNRRRLNAYKRLRYPESYKEVIHITKFERDTFNSKSSRNPARLLTYEFVNVWPTNMTSMKVNYGGSNVLKLSVQLAYDRFFTSYTIENVNPLPFDNGTPTTSDLVNRFDFKSNLRTNEYYNNFGIDAQDNTNFGNFFSGRRVDQGVFGAEAQA